MNLLFSMLLLLLLVPQNQNSPAAFHQLPEQVKEKATVIVAGTYAEGRSPCIFMPDGTRIWALLSWFNVKKVYRGEVGGKTIHVNSSVSPIVNKQSGLAVGRDYLVLLRPNAESLKAIKEGEHLPFWKALDGDEIVAIVELK